jgi:hypothetical protein
MKKILFILVAIFTFSFINAQEVHFGAKAGLNLATMNSSDSEFNNLIDGSRTAFHAGAVIDISFSDKFSVQPELLYSSVGAIFDYDGVARYSESEFGYVLDYLSIPVMAKYYVADGFSLEVGPQIGFLLSAKAENDSDEEDIKEYTESTDFGLGFGAGYKMENGLFFNARYNLGLSNIFSDVDDGDWFKNNVFQFSVGFMFN